VLLQPRIGNLRDFLSAQHITNHTARSLPRLNA
jgi:hypothetical protein